MCRRPPVQNLGGVSHRTEPPSACYMKCSFSAFGVRILAFMQPMLLLLRDLAHTKMIHAEDAGEDYLSDCIQ